jgi:tRNA(Phe) wybutosine-synthesizing methylase Tyw3
MNLSPYLKKKKKILEELDEAKLICTSLDPSNHIDLKIVPVIYIFIQRMLSRKKY